jgi:predicted Rossmann fold nucleotide-binding protein DprA/Smf involved in DNA uptake
MKPAPIPLPSPLRERGAALGLGAGLTGVGNAGLLTTPLLGLCCSRGCPGGVIIDNVEQVPVWVKEGRVLLSGFHAPLEQQVLWSLLRRGGAAVKLLARGMLDYRPPPEEAEPLPAGRLLVATAFPPEVRRITRRTALERNRQVIALASELFVPYVADGSPLAALLAEAAGIKPVEVGGNDSTTDGEG